MIEVVEPGVLTSVQDASGRRGWRHLGVPVGGAADAWSARLANRLVGNPDEAALLEMTLIGPTLRFTHPAVVAVTGMLEASVDGVPLPPATARRMREGAVLRVEAGDGARGYLAVAGGLDVPEVLGSRSTDLRSGFGGFGGRALRSGDLLTVGDPSGPPKRWVGHANPIDLPIRIVPGPHADEVETLDREFSVAVEADRTGMRLTESVAGGGEARSMGLPLGAIQVAPDGRPIVMLADRPVTGGYRVPAVVIGADVPRVAQLRTGDPVRFTSVSMEEARAAWQRAEQILAALEPLDGLEGDALGWIGSHR